MADNNLIRITHALQHLRDGMAPYVAHELEEAFGEDWWQYSVLNRLNDVQRSGLPVSGFQEKLIGSLDCLNCLTLFADIHWNEVFSRKLSKEHRNWAIELKSVRARQSHPTPDKKFNDSDTWRALDTMTRLCEQIDGEQTEKIRELQRDFKYGSPTGTTAVLEAPTALPQVQNPPKAKAGASPPPAPPISVAPQGWRSIIQPQIDVQQGRYKNAEFAADLAQVARGEAAAEYQDPVEFFARTYVTEGMAGLLVQSLKRISGKDGEPVIELKTAFGGGKTHSMLALYHALRGRAPLAKIPNLKPILERAGLQNLPNAHVAVLVGTALDPNKSKRPPYMPGITINTIWGEMAAQIARSANNPKLYDLIKASDKNGRSPGSETLKELFDKAGPCVILLDELVAYGRKLSDKADIPAGTFANFISFIQELTEAARASKKSLVVASIPESDIEIGGAYGKIVLETIERTFGRMESIWKPVAANEGFEVVRRRLFLGCKDEPARAAVCNAFSEMYAQNPNDFPMETKEVEYRERLLSCYPIHPEIFDRLYTDWATLDGFQRTRGVLRMMAAVIHELWMSNDSSLMIMPGSLPMDVPPVRDEITHYLPEGWNAIVDAEVDGKKSIPYQKEQQQPRFANRQACRRLTRTIFLGSAPTGRQTNIKGIEASRIRLGTIQPRETISDFNDALSALASSLTYLFTNPSGDRYWFDTRPTLRKTVEDRATQIKTPDIEYEIEKRLRKVRKEPPFEGVHTVPSSSLDVPDEQTARLVVLHPNDSFKRGREDCAALTAAADILNNRGNTPRIYRNMLAFAAPDAELVKSLEQTVRIYLAWQSIKEDSEDLNLDAAQNRETRNNVERYERTVDDQLREAYCWLLTPHIDRSRDIKVIRWTPDRLSGGNESFVAKAAKKMLQNEQVITKWAPALLKMELDNLLWRDSNHIQIKTLWEQLCTYCYLPRLAAERVLTDAILTGLNSTEFFAWAAAVDGERYVDLKYNLYLSHADRSGYLVKIPAAEAQLAVEEAKRRAEEEQRREAETVLASKSRAASGAESGTIILTKEDDPPAVGPAIFGDGPYAPQGNADAPAIQPAPRPKNTRFYMSADLDTTRINRDMQKLAEEVIQHLTAVPGASVKVSLEVEAQYDKGFPPQTVRTVSENCRTLRVRSSEFDE
jgi:predicted AAA+ superfamily ATPase